jgi:cytochrome c-type biogenesis protein CcmF
MREDGTTAFETRIAFHPLVWALSLGAIFIVLGGALSLSGRLRARATLRVPADPAPQSAMEASR